MKSTLHFFHLVLFSVMTQAGALAADNQVATLTQLQGRVQIFAEPSKKMPAKSSLESGTVVLFEGEYFKIRDAKVGDPLQNGMILRTLPNGTARGIYENGDQIHVGPGTAYRIQWNKKDDLDVELHMMYGRLRGVIEKGGPRGKLKIRTKAATLGVRGTDFFIADTGPKGETEVSVVRGAVSVQPNATSGQEAKSVEVKTGMTATVLDQAARPESPIGLRTTTIEDLKGIQQSSATQGKVLPSNEVGPTLASKIAVLEKKAIEVTKKDIQLYQPEVYQQISKDFDTVKNIQELNSRTLEIAKATAPSAPVKRKKPTITELKDTEDKDVYEKYFKLEEK